MPGFTINELPTVPLVHQQHFWRAEQIGPIKPIERNESILLQELTLPGPDFDVHEQKGASLIYKYASFVKWTDATIIFYDVYGLFAKLEEWRAQIWTPGEGIKPKKQYADNTVIIMTDGEGTEFARYTLVNSWPKTIGHGLLTYTASGAKLVNLTLACDYVTYQES